MNDDNRNSSTAVDPEKLSQQLSAEQDTVRQYVETHRDQIRAEYKQMPESQYGRLHSAELYEKLVVRMMERDVALPKVSHEARAHGSFTSTTGVRHFGYYDDSYQAATFNCPKCHWTGPYEKLEYGIDEYGDEHFCPSCGTLLAITTSQRPLPENWRELERQHELRILAALPDIDEEEFTLTFELEWGQPGKMGTGTYHVRHNGKTIYSEGAGYEDYPVFVRLCKVLKEKYGNRILDLVPRGRGCIFTLYGDGGGIGEVARARETLTGRKMDVVWD